MGNLERFLLHQLVCVENLCIFCKLLKAISISTHILNRVGQTLEAHQVLDQKLRYRGAVQKYHIGFLFALHNDQSSMFNALMQIMMIYLITDGCIDIQSIQTNGQTELIGVLIANTIMGHAQRTSAKWDSWG